MTTKWEYAVRKKHNDGGELLADYGKQGWELVTVTCTDYLYTYFFKRPIKTTRTSNAKSSNKSKT